MTEFFETYKTELFYTLLVVIAVMVLRLLTNLARKWLIKQEQKKSARMRPKAINLVKRILNSLWFVLGVMAIIFLFFGDTYIKLQHNFRILIYLGLVAVVSIVFASSANIWFGNSIQRKIENQEDPTSFKFLRYVAVFGIYGIGILLALLVFPSLKGVAQTALGGAGVIALIVAVASQEALANLVGGVFIISFKPFKIGDVIRVSDSMRGKVVDITLRHTVLRNYDNKMIVIPNAMINKEKLINYNLWDLRICDRIEIGISYDSDVDLAKKIMREECENHPLILDYRSATDVMDGKPKVRVALISLNDFSVTIRAWAWAKNYDESFAMRCDLLETIKKRFHQEGVEIPFPYRTIIFKDNTEQQTS